MSLSPTQKRYLRGLAQALNPVIMTGHKGVTDAVTREFSQALDHHELVKVKLGSDDRADRAAQIAVLIAASGAEMVQSIGRTASFYLRNAKQPRIALPK